MLALWPRNADRHVALSALVDILATDPKSDPPGQPAIEPQDWRRWLASADSASVRAVQPAGVHDTPPAVPVVIAGKPGTLLGGALPYPDVHYRTWAEAIEVVLSETHDEALERALGIIRVGTWLSARAAALGALPHYPWPDHRLPLKLASPSKDEYAQLLDAVAVPLAELAAAGINEDVLLPLLRAKGAPVLWRPLSLEQDGKILLIADPWNLTRSVLLRACANVARSERMSDVIEHARIAVSRIALRSANDMDWGIENVDGDGLVVVADVDCRILITTLVLPPDQANEPSRELHQPKLLQQLARRAHAKARSLNASYSLLALLGDGRAVMANRGHPAVNDRPPRQWTVGIGELQLLGESLRRDPLAVPSALERLPPRPWPENISLVDVIGAVRRDESPLPERRYVPRDGTEHLRVRSYVMSARQPAPSRDGSGWCEVTRWGGSQDRHIFCDPEDDQFSLLVRSHGVSIWVTAADPTVKRFDLPGMLCVMLAHWLARVCEDGRLLSPDELLIPIRVEVTDQAGPTLIAAADDDGLRLVAGPSLVRELCRGDNSGDRTLVHAVLRTIAPQSVSLLDQILAAGRGTFTIWPSPDITSNPPAFEPPPVVHPRDRLRVERELASSVLPEEHIAIIRNEEVLPYLCDLMQPLDLMITTCASTFAVNRSGNCGGLIA